MDDIQLFNDDCFNIFPTLEDKSINLFILDLPYGQTACKWDTVIDLDKMWKHIKRIMKPNALIVFFCTAKFGNTLINANPKWFKYDLIWKKSRKVGFLSANKMPLRQHENIYVFKDKQGTYHPQKTEGKPYIDKRNRTKTNSYGTITENYIVENKGDRHPTSIIEHENIYVFKDKQGTYHPQKTKGKPYTKDRKGHSKEKYCYGEIERGEDIKINKGDRHPTSIIEHENIYVFKDKQGTYHPQKTKGKAYNKTNTGNNNKDSCAYGTIDRSSHLEGEGNRKINKGDRHPTSIIEHENIYVFDNPVNEEYNDLELSRNKDLREYAEKVKKFINKPLKEIEKKLGNMGVSHFYSFKGSQFGLPTKKTYDFLIKEYNIDEIEGFLDYEILEVLWEKPPPKVESTYNSQKTEGTPLKLVHKPKGKTQYGNQKGCPTRISDGSRHPTSIIEHENIYVFDNTITDDIELSRNKDLREYAEKVFKFIGKTKKQIIKKIGQKIDHYFRFKSSQFGLCTIETYNELIKEYKIDEMEEYLEYEILESLWEGNPTYNPQKTEGKPYKMKEGTKLENNVYGNIIRKGNNKGDRHPTSILNEIPEYEGDTVLVYKNPHKTIHRTQKPVELLEWLIKTYSNEGDLIMDFTMGSGTCGVACMNTKRKFIGVEMDKEIYDSCFDRIEKHKKNL